MVLPGPETILAITKTLLAHDVPGNIVLLVIHDLEEMNENARIEEEKRQEEFRALIPGFTPQEA